MEQAYIPDEQKNFLPDFLLFLFLISCLSCKTNTLRNEQFSPIEVQGHRGDRGNFPENSIPAFMSAVQKGADVLELDVVISRDRKVIVSHEPYMSSEYMSTPEKAPVQEEEEEKWNLFRMNYNDIRKFDAGSRGNADFPEQQKMETYKPLLSEVFESIEEFVRSEDLRPVRYNIELKSEPSEYGVSQPLPEEFVDLVMQDIRTKGVGEKVNIQSFDPAILNLFRRKYPEIPIAFLVESGEIEENLERLDFKPEIYSPHFSLLDEQAMESLRARNLRVIPWTVNEEEDIRQMIELGVDGIISDYPERVIQALESSEQ